jgi:hypothetical protein
VTASPAEQAAAEHFARACNRDESNPSRNTLGNLGHDVEDAEPSWFADEARALVAALRPILAAEVRKAAGDALADLAPKQATPDARDAFWRAAVIARSSTPTEGTDR